MILDAAVETASHRLVNIIPIVILVLSQIFRIWIALCGNGFDGRTAASGKVDPFDRPFGRIEVPYSTPSVEGMRNETLSMDSGIERLVT